jgi:hypothetical protein
MSGVETQGLFRNSTGDSKRDGLVIFVVLHPLSLSTPGVRRSRGYFLLRFFHQP